MGPTSIGTVIGVTKAYVTRVGEGPFPTEIDDDSATLLRARGQEYGAVTGRPRRCGWLDLPLLRYSNMINGTEWLVVTKMDVMDECAEIPVCTGYKIDGKVTDMIPADMRGFESIHPVYTTLKGWNALDRGHYGVRQAAQAGAGVSGVSGAGVGREDRDGLDRAGARPDDDAAGVRRRAESVNDGSRPSGERAG